MIPNNQPESGKYAFITSTPFYSAKEKKETKTLVRKHVMRPFMKRNQPKRVNGLKKIAPKASVGASQLQPRSSTSNEEEAEVELEFGVPIGSQINSMVLLGNGRVNPFQSWPIKMSRQEHKLVHHIWDPSQTFQPFRDFWFPLGTNDPAGMHLILSNAALHLNALRGNQDENCESIMYHLSAVKSVNRRLANLMVEHSDGILGAILGFMCHDHILSNVETWKIHYAGFCKILALRGGLSTIEKIPSIRLSLFWIEHNMSSDLDVVPLFPAPLQYLTNLYTPKYQVEGELHFSRTCEYSGIGLFLSERMLDIMRQLSIVTITIIHESEKRNLSNDLQFLWGDQNFAGLCLYPILSRLLFIQKELNDEVEELCRIGGILFLAQARRWFRVGPVLATVPITKLRHLLESDGDIWSTQVKNLRIWTLIMAGCAASTENERTWVVEMLRRDVFHWVELENFKNMWWIDELFRLGLSQIEMVIHSFQDTEV